MEKMIYMPFIDLPYYEGIADLIDNFLIDR